MQNNRLSKEEEAAYVDSFFLPGGILDDFDLDEQAKEETPPDEQRFLFLPLAVSSNPWNAAMAAAATVDVPSIARVASIDTATPPWLDPTGSQPKPLRRPPGLSPDPDLPPSLLPTPLPVGIERLIESRLAQNLSASDLLPSMSSHSMLETPTASQYPSDIILGSSALGMQHRHALDDSLSISSAIVGPTIGSNALHNLQFLRDDQAASLLWEETIDKGSPVDEGITSMHPIHVPTPQRQSPTLVATGSDVKKVETIYLEDEAKPPLADAPAAKGRPSGARNTATSSTSVPPSNGDKRRAKDSTCDSESSTDDKVLVENGSSLSKQSSDAVEEKSSAVSEKRVRPNNGKLDTQSSRGDASVSQSTTDEDKRPKPPTRKTSSEQPEARRRGAPTTGVPGKIAVSAPRNSLAILGFLEDVLNFIVLTTVTIFKWLSLVYHGIFDAYEIIVLVFRQMFMMGGFSGAAVAKLVILVAWGLRNIGKYAVAEVQHEDGTAWCYLMFYLTQRLCDVLMTLVDLPQYTPHILSHFLVFVLCLPEEPDALRPGSQTRTHVSSGGNERLTSDICTAILRTIRILLPLNLIWDGFEKEIAAFLRLGGPVRMMLAFLLSLVRSRLILSPVAWVSWSAQVLATAYFPSGLVLDGSLLLWGLASIHLVRSIDSENFLRQHDTKSS